MKLASWLIVAAILEVGGDALVRLGVHQGRWWGFLAGALSLFAYSLLVNFPKQDFGRLLGVYIAVFFLVAQTIAFILFRERPAMPTLLGGILIVAGGVVVATGSGK